MQLWLSAFARIALLSAAAGVLVARHAVLLLATAFGLSMQCMAIQTLVQPAKVRRYLLLQVLWVQAPQPRHLYRHPFTGELADVQCYGAPRPQAPYHERVKTQQTLVSMTVCMICAVMSNRDELNLKAPVAILAMRSIFHLAERYRLLTLLRLQWVNLVRPVGPRL